MLIGSQIPDDIAIAVLGNQPLSTLFYLQVDHPFQQAHQEGEVVEISVRLTVVVKLQLTTD